MTAHVDLHVQNPTMWYVALYCMIDMIRDGSCFSHTRRRLIDELRSWQGRLVLAMNVVGVHAAVRKMRCVATLLVQVLF